MSRKDRNTNLSEEELRDLLMMKKSTGREARIAAYRASGRVVDEDTAPINSDLSWNPKEGKPEGRQRPPGRRKLDKFLLAVEICAVLGIIVLLAMSSQILRRINDEAAKAFIQPPLTPTPLIQAVVLPGGHTAPDANGNAVFNEGEIPEHLRSMIGVISHATAIPAVSGQVVRIRIPSINVDAPVVQGDDWEALKNGVGLSAYSGQPGEMGNVILSGHNDIFGQVFQNLENVNPGDEIMLLTEKSAYTYVVTGTQIVQPSQVEVLQQTSESVVTLISCYPYLVDTQRIVVTGKLRE